MKLIVSEMEALRRYVSREFYFVMKGLITVHGWRQIETWKLRSGHGTVRDKLLREFGELPEVMLFWEGYNFLREHAADIYRLDCRKYIFADDLHCWDEPMRQSKLVGFALCDAVLAAYGYLWEKFYPVLSGVKRVVWVPHSASTDFMLPLNPHPENSIFLSGAIDDHYPLRQQLKALHARRAYPIAHHGFPGYHCQYDYERDGDVGRGYAQRINRHRAGFTDSAKFRYVVAKYFEIPATGALLLADGAVGGPLKRLGFIEGRHYLSVSSENLEERIRYVLDERNHPELDDIRRRGQELIREKHKTSDRAKLIDESCRP